MIWALVDSENTVQNIIVYDGITPYVPPNSLTLQQINPWVKIGQSVHTPQPSGD